MAQFFEIGSAAEDLLLRGKNHPQRIDTATFVHGVLEAFHFCNRFDIHSIRHIHEATALVDDAFIITTGSYKLNAQRLQAGCFHMYLGWHPTLRQTNTRKYGPYMAGTEATTALNVAKSINKFVFMDEIMLSGDLTSIGGPGTHLYVLTKLLAAAADSSRPTFLDAGCGTGYLLMAWAVAIGSGSQAIGIDINAANVAAAKRHLANPEALDNLVAHVPADASMDVRVGDALNPDAARLGLKRRSVDAINVGLAVESEAELAPLAELLRAGGVMAAPVCEPLAKRQPVPEGRCDSRFKIFRKKEDGSLQREDGDPDIPVTFIVAQRNKGSGSANLRGR